MSAGLSRIERFSFANLGHLFARSGPGAASPAKRSLLLLAAILLLGGGAWLLLPASNGQVVGTEPVSSNLAAHQTESSASEAGTVGLAASSADAASLQGLRISSQTWRRGGLGSKALVTFTLRNDNDYAVKDVEISCAFNRRDGSHLTDRRRVLPETVDMKSRKTFAQVHIGFVNINASQAKCSAVAARRT